MKGLWISEDVVNIFTIVRSQPLLLSDRDLLDTSDFINYIKTSYVPIHLYVLVSEYVAQNFNLPFLLKLVQLLIGQVLDGRGHLLEVPLEPLPETLIVRLPSELHPVLAILRGQGQSSDVELL